MYKKLMVICLIFSLCTLFLPSVYAAENNKGSLEVQFLNVSEGEATLMKTPQGKVVLLDGGGVSDGEKIIKKLKALGIKKIDLVIASHPHSRNIGGLIKIFAEIPVGQVIDSGVNYNSASFQQYKEVLAQKQIPVNCAENNLVIPIDNGIEMEFLAAGGSSDPDSGSLVCRLNYGKISFLFTGDASASCLENLATTATILKVPQRGGQGSLSEEFVSKLRPKEAIIFTADKNAYAAETKEILQKYQVRAHLVTAKEGLAVTSNGENYKISAILPEKITVQPSGVAVRPTGKHIIISRSQHTLYLYNNGQLIKQYKVAVGKPSTPTPLGNFSVVNKIKHPPKPCFGVRWLGFYPKGWPSYGIHGTDVPSSIGKSVSHGCVRLHNENIMELYYSVDVGTPVTIIR